MVQQNERWVRSGGGAQNRQIYWDHGIYERELEQIFARCWTLVGHESLIPKPGDFITSYIGEDAIIVARQKNGEIKAFINACRHRGNKVCHAQSGSARSFVCNYHGWAYGLDGSLKDAPLENEKYGYRGCLNKSGLGLTPVAQLDTYHGLIFATFDQYAPSLVDYLGEMAWYLDVYFNASEEGTYVLGPPSKVRIKSNWKIPSDNFAGDSYHVGWTHASIIKLAEEASKDGTIGPVASGNEAADTNNGFQVSTRYGHGCGFSADGVSGFVVLLKDRDLGMRFLEQSRQKIIDRLGAFRGEKLYGSHVHATVFPNFSLLAPGLSTIKVWHPRGPHEIEVWSYPLIDAGWPKELQEAVAHNTMMTFQPTGVFEADDAENFEYCTSTNRGWITRQQTNDSSMGSRERSKVFGDLPGFVTDGMMGEEPQRGFYNFWSQLMDGREWSEITERERNDD